MPSYRQPEFTRLKSKIGVDLTELISLTCEHWDDLLVVNPDILNELTHAFVERRLSQYQGYRSSMQLARELRYVMAFIHGELHPYVEMVADEHMPNDSILLRMLGWQCRGLILELSPRPIEIYTPHELPVYDDRRRFGR